MSKETGTAPRPLYLVGNKHKAGRMLDGQTWDEMPVSPVRGDAPSVRTGEETTYEHAD